MNKYRVAVIGCGRPWKTEGATGFGMSHQHVQGFLKTGKCELVAVADIEEKNARAFVQDHNPQASVYLDYVQMMSKEKPDFVSVSLWPHLHGQVVCDLVKYSPKAIHCEKPMDINWDASLKMQQDCAKAGIQLTINHQRRFNKPFQKARDLIAEGQIGKLLRLEAAWHNFQDSGTHWLDMLFFLNGDSPAEWVMGQIDLRGSRRVFGALQEGHGFISFRFKNAVRAAYLAGKDYRDLGCMIRATGSEGMLEIPEEGPHWLRLHRFDKGGWETVDTAGEGIHGNEANWRAVADLVDSLEAGRKPLLSSENAIRPTEIFFAAYESALRRARVDLPLPPGPSSLLKMAGEIKE